jgi:hypothetical protein
MLFDWIGGFSQVTRNCGVIFLTEGVSRPKNETQTKEKKKGDTSTPPLL